MARIKWVGVDTEGVYLPINFKGFPPIYGIVRSAAFRDPQLDPPTVPAGEKFDVKDPLADFRPATHQHPPPTTDASNPQMLYPKRLQRAFATKTRTAVCDGHAKLLR